MLKGYRTIIVNAALFIVLLASALTGQIEDPEALRWIAIGTTVANVVLRFLTSTAVGKGTGDA